ncbi:BadF/BadG/BcrA/BcrD ATPase family protein [Lichenihabitans sp. Uapishka_5]|uniref:N-acetylglucosamine kinase n=1 Tax=Lichenihabitans sp. Uapishka_5 TaxID=3037302 RepID=UPI0029E803A9|nr:BadF/BadG/BcrA/BcrD ATPase family protein [Lichenihabitans sp. Uapishka_5]MDX7950802.1 BadF/BadG/BcrA/BcrD ATPase family protein [Lichenihabitans sp. Uapishka_5]
MAPDPDLILGLDGGGTKTLIAVADRDGAILYLRRHPSLDPFTHPDWADRLRAMLAGLSPWYARLAEAVLALPCHGEVADLSERQRAVASELIACRHEVVNDVEAAFDGALAGAPGVLLLAGTGSMAWSGNGSRTMRCGGWGDVFGDEGSAYWIGREALAEVSRALDGRSSNMAFAHAVLAGLGLDAGDLLGWCYDLPARRASIAALASSLDAQAEAGEPSALAILRRAGDALAAHAEACARQLDLRPPLAWSHAGGVFHSRTVMRRVTGQLGSEPLAPRLPPVGGALLRAAQRAGWRTEDTWIERLDRALSEGERSAWAA